MRKILSYGVLSTVLLVGGCSESGVSSSDQSSVEQEFSVADLTGTWSTENVNDGDTWMEAVIAEGTISIDWVLDGGDTRSVYWVGTFDPTVDGSPSAVVSERSVEETERALLASSADTKDFTYDDGELSYSQSALGTTTTIVLEQQSAETGSASLNNQEEEPTVEIVDSGFGQGERTAQAIVIATNSSEAAVGEFVTVSVNFLDAEGGIIATEEQVEVFEWVGQELVLPVWLGSTATVDATVASVEPSVAISDYGGENSSNAPLPILEATEVTQGGSSYTASFEFTNETAADIENLRVGVVCYDATGQINGGGSDYPNLAPAGGTIAFDASVTVSGQPDSCKAHLNY